MGRIEKTVFISYRRTNFPWALAIFQDLTQHGYDVFFDFTGLASGDFEPLILENVRARAHFLVLLTPSALERCVDPADWLRREIEAALDGERNIVPLMVEGFDFGTPTIASQLTGKLALLRHYNALSIPPAFFFEAMGRLRDRYLNVPLDAVSHPVSPAAREAATEQKAAAGMAPAVAEEELTAQQWFERGFNAKDLDEQLRFYSQAIRLKPDYADAFVGRGGARSGKGDMEGALADCNEAIRLRPDLAFAFDVRGAVRAQKSDLEGALEDFNEAIRLNPDDAVGFVGRGGARSEKGDLEGAIEDHSAAVSLKPDFAFAFHCRGDLRRAKGDLEGALEDYDEAIRLKPDFAEAFNNRGIARGDKGDLEGARKDFDEAIRLKPDFAVAFNDRGIARSRQRRLGGGAAGFQRGHPPQARPC